MKIEIVAAAVPGYWRLFLDGVESKDGTNNPDFTRHGADLAARAAISAWSKALDKAGQASGA